MESYIVDKKYTQIFQKILEKNPSIGRFEGLPPSSSVRPEKELRRTPFVLTFTSSSGIVKTRDDDDSNYT